MMKWIVLIAGLALILMIVGVILVWPHLWFEANAEAVSIDGERALDVKIYISPGGEILLRNGRPDGYENYIIREQQQELGYRTRITSFLCYFPCTAKR